MMDAHEALRTRRTVNFWADEPVPWERVEAALELALLAPNHKMTEPWRFTRVQGELRQRIFEVNRDLKAQKMGTLGESQLAKLRAKMLNPAELLVVRQVNDPDPFRSKEDYAACACAIQNLCVALHADGIGSKWSSGGVTTDPQTYELVGVDPSKETIIGFIWIGLPAPDGPTSRPRRKLGLADVLSEVGAVE